MEERFNTILLYDKVYSVALDKQEISPKLNNIEDFEKTLRDVVLGTEHKHPHFKETSGESCHDKIFKSVMKKTRLTDKERKLLRGTFKNKEEYMRNFDNYEILALTYLEDVMNDFESIFKEVDEVALVNFLIKIFSMERTIKFIIELNPNFAEFCEICEEVPEVVAYGITYAILILYKYVISKSTAKNINEPVKDYMFQQQRKIRKYSFEEYFDRALVNMKNLKTINREMTKNERKYNRLCTDYEAKLFILDLLYRYRDKRSILESISYAKQLRDNWKDECKEHNINLGDLFHYYAVVFEPYEL